MEYRIVLAYLLAIALLTVLGAPIAAAIFREFPDRGAAFALPTALIPFAIAVFWLGQLTFGLHAVLFGVAVVGVGALYSYRRGGVPDWNAVTRAYGVFAVGFLLLVLLRASRPSITPAGGEQFLHFGLVKAIERASSLPPEDFWYAGEPLRYYYGTQLQVTSLSMLTGTPLRYGFNLGIAVFYGVLFVVAYGLSSALVAARGYSARLGGVLGAFFVALGGPTTTPIRLLTPHLPDWLADPVARAAFGFVAQRFHGGDLGAAVTDLSTPLDWTWWYTRYVVPGTIQEVPLYSFVKADLHGHALSTGYVLFAGAVAYAYYRMPAADRRRRVVTLFGGLGAIAGVFGFMNTWSLPTAGGLAVLAAGSAAAHPATLLPERVGSALRPTAADAGDGSRIERVAAELWRLLLAGVAGIVVVLVGVAVASPFLIFGHVPTNEGIGFLPPRSPLGPFLVIYAGLLAMFAVYVLARAWPAIRALDWSKPVTARLGPAVVLLTGVLSIAMVVAGFAFDFAVLAVTGPLLLCAWVLVRSDRGDFALVLLVAGVGLVLSLELVHARLPQIDFPRWNTALKVAVQGWTLSAVGAGAGAALVLSRGWGHIAAFLSDRRSSTGATEVTTSKPAETTTSESNEATASDHSRLALVGSSASVVLVCLILLSALVFPAMVVGQEIGSDVAEGNYNPTLDGFAVLEQFRSDQAAAIDWLDDRSGTPTIVEAPGPSYRFTSPASTFTGLPTVVGWDHQEEYRSPEAYERRVTHVDQIYTAEFDTAASRLQRYDVRYVYVGPNERERYGEELRSFDRPAFSVAFDNEAVTIYAVDQSALERHVHE